MSGAVKHSHLETKEVCPLVQWATQVVWLVRAVKFQNVELNFGFFCFVFFCGF